MFGKHAKAVAVLAVICGALVADATMMTSRHSAGAQLPPVAFGRLTAGLTEVHFPCFLVSHHLRSLPMPQCKQLENTCLFLLIA